MGLKSLLIVLVLLGAKDSKSAFISAFLIFSVAIINLLLKNFLKNEEGFAVNIIITAIFAGIISLLISRELPLWHEEYKTLIFTLPVVPIAMLEYINVEKKLFIKELLLFLQGLVSIGILKELLAFGTVFDFKLLEAYEGIVYFDTNSSTLLLIALALIIYSKVGEYSGKNN